MSKPKLLIVEDNENLRSQLKWALAKEYEVFSADDRKSAMDLFVKNNPELVTLDLGLPPDPDGVEEGFRTLAGILERDVLSKVIIITGQEEKEHALRAIAEGAYDFIPKPVQVEELKVILQRAFHVSRLEREHRELQERLAGSAFHDMLGISPQMQAVFAVIRKVATTDAPVLIEGESGTGKELAARAVHSLSDRSRGPFIAINCGAIPENLLESELFGHEKGAFTGAHIQRKGRIESAQGGTLFLDEVGELSLLLQVKLLRFLQDHKLERVGGREQISVDVRVLAATNTDLDEAMKTGQFREDLYYRLNVVTISIPPLRERVGDIQYLAKWLLQQYAGDSKKTLSGFTPQALRAMESYGWPGNVRELENRIRRGVIMSEGSTLTAADLELDSLYSSYTGLALKEAREALERDMVQQALGRHQGNITQAATDLGISRPTLYELIDKLGIQRK